jgi:hypothetical protein
MYFRIAGAAGYLRADLFARETAEETREFLNALAEKVAEQSCCRVLISVHRSKPVFRVGQYDLLSYFAVARRSALKIALLGDSEELRIAHQYVESLAHQHDVNLRAFRAEADALRWLRADDRPEPASAARRGDARPSPGSH